MFNLDEIDELPIIYLNKSIVLPTWMGHIRIPHPDTRHSKNYKFLNARFLDNESESESALQLVGIVTQQEDQASDEPKVGTTALIKKVLKVYSKSNKSTPTSYMMTVIGIQRFKFISYKQREPYDVAVVDHRLNVDVNEEDDDVKKLRDRVKKHMENLYSLYDDKDPNYDFIYKFMKSFGKLVFEELSDACLYALNPSFKETLNMIPIFDPKERAMIVIEIIECEINNQKKQIALKKANSHNVKSMPSAIISMDMSNSQYNGLMKKIEDAKLPKSVEKVVIDHLNATKSMGRQNIEYALIINYIETILSMPWNKVAPEVCNIKKAKIDLDEAHFGLEKVKKRILEFLAVRQLKGGIKTPILCFVGPPGVGKTTIAKSIAKTLGRPFHRIALGGISDASEIRGHRRTYIGSMPGRIITGLKSAQVKNPVLLLDEIDKLDRGVQGNPASALLEVLDEEQNDAFTDLYLAVPFDISQVLFITTANKISTIPAPLLDRLEIIRIPGYSSEEKLIITKHHVIPKQISQNGLNSDHLSFEENALKNLITQYTDEAGVRSLERKIASLFRSIAIQLAEFLENQKDLIDKNNNDLTEDVLMDENDDDCSKEVEISKVSPAKKSMEKDNIKFHVTINDDFILSVLGPPMYHGNMHDYVNRPGIAIGLAWTISGGEVLVVEASFCGGKQKLTLTGQLGDVMRESSMIAYNWVKTNAHKFNIDSKQLEKGGELHIHFPAGAVNKDGPSAGVTVATAIMSLLYDTCILPKVAMTGEITLNGMVLPVGGIKEKVLAAHSKSYTTVILPFENQKDVIDIPDNILKEVNILYAKRIEDVLAIVLGDDFQKLQSKL